MAKTTKLVGYGIAFDMKLVGGAKTADDFKKAAKSVQKSLNASENAVKQYELKQEQLNQALKQGAITKKQYDQAMTTLAFREQKRIDRLERERRAVLGLDKQESILERNRRNRARMAGMAASGVSGLGFGGRMAGAARFLGGAAGLGGPAAALGLGFGTATVLKESIKAFAKLQSQVTAMKSLFGEDIADGLVKQFRQLSKSTILTNEQLIENAKTWASYGLTTEGLTDRLKRLGTVAGGNSEKFRALTVAFAQVNAQGKLMGQEKNQLINAGMSLSSVAKAAGISMDEFADKMKNGEITAEHLNQALIDITSEGGMFAGYLEEQAETINGKITVLTASWEEFLAALGKTEEGPLSVLLDQLITITKEMNEAARFFSGEDFIPTAGESGVREGRFAGTVTDEGFAADTFGGRAGQAGRPVIMGGMGGGLPVSPIAETEAERIAKEERKRLLEEEEKRKESLERVDKLSEEFNKKQFKQYMENVKLAEEQRFAKTGGYDRSLSERADLFVEAEEVRKNFGESAEQEFKKSFPEVFKMSFEETAKFFKDQATENAKKDFEKQSQLQDKQNQTLFNLAIESAKEKAELEFSLLKDQFKQREQGVSEQLAMEKRIAKGPKDKDAYFTGGSVKEFMFLRRQAQVNEEAKATKEAEDRAQEQRRQINEERKQAEIEFRAIMAEFMGRESFVGPQPLAN